MDDKLRITLMIGDIQYSLNINRADEQVYRNASKLINNKLNKYRAYFDKLDPIRVMSMVALEIAVEKVGLENKNDTAPYIEKLEELTKELEAYFKKEK